MLSIPPLNVLKIQYEEECIDFLFEEDILEESLCLLCDSNVRREKKIFRCMNQGCRKTVSIFANTFFAKNHLNCSNVMLVGYYWLCDSNYTAIQIIMGCSSNTIIKYMRLFRRLVIETLDDNDQKIGGNNVIVEIDESKFQSRKGEDGIWVIGGVERTNDKKCFFEVVKQRDARTIDRIVNRHVKRGSIIITDMWRGYGNLRLNVRYRHIRVNHGENFVDPVTGAHTNTIEGTWNGIKLKIQPRNRDERFINEHLLEFIWRRKNRDHLWEGFLDALRNE
jgi:ISXO2-like transposase domain